MSTVITLAGVRVRRDSSGRYSLNDLHRAAVLRDKATATHRPGNFIKRPETQGLIRAIEKRCYAGSITSVSAIKGNGEARGTFVLKPLVIAYAMWIDADFHLDVIEAFDANQSENISLWQRMLALVARDKKSSETASVAGVVLNERKGALIGIRAEKRDLQHAMEPDLFDRPQKAA